MPQFNYLAMNTEGRNIEGSVTATDMIVAAEQIRRLQLTPIQVQQVSEGADEEVASGSPRVVEGALPAVSAGWASSAPAGAVDLSQAHAAVLPGWNGHTGQAEAASQSGTRLEPWERSVGRQDSTPAPVAPTVIASNLPEVAALGTAVGTSPSGQVRLAAIPYGARRTEQSSFGRVLQEHLILPLTMRRAQQEMAVFYREIAALIGAGIPLYQVFVGVEGNTSNAILKEIAHEGAKQVQAGGRFSDVMAAYAWVFPSMHVQLVRAAETGGMLDEVFRRIAAYTEHDLEVRRLISRETLYPKIVLFVALMLLGAHGLQIGADASHLAIVELVVRGDVIGYLADTVGFGAACLFCFWAISSALRLMSFNLTPCRDLFDRVKLAIPGISGIVRMFATAKFMRTTAALYRGGFGMHSCLQIAGDSSDNSVLRQAAYEAASAAESGRSASEAISASGFFPSISVGMFRTGEATGDLDEMLDKNADYFEDEAKMLLHRVCLIGGVLVFLILAIYIGCVIISLYGSLAGKEMGAGGG